MSVATDLPDLTSDEAEHSARLEARVREEIARGGGWISFARYMELALYAPLGGYYTGGAQKFGREGDFVTAPEMTPLFARALAHQVAEILAGSGGHLLEFGAGPIQFHLDGFKRETQDYHIPGYARSQRLRESDPRPEAAEPHDVAMDYIITD